MIRWLRSMFRPPLDAEIAALRDALRDALSRQPTQHQYRR